MATDTEALSAQIAIRVTPAVKAAWTALPRPLSTLVLRRLIEHMVAPPMLQQLTTLVATDAQRIDALLTQVVPATLEVGHD